MPKYSIIVPVYNCIDYLPACVESILSLTANDFELLLIVDGATDGSGALCDELAEKHSQIKAFHKANGGAASARNIGIEKAHGDYLLFFDGDDTVEPNTLELVDKAMADADMVIFGMAFDYYGRNEALERTENLSCKHEGGYETAEIVKCFKSFFEDNALSSACNKCFRADIIRENGLRFIEGMTLYEDMEFVLRYLDSTKTVSCIGQALYHYRLSSDEKHLKSRVSNLDKVRDNLGQLTKAILALNSKEATDVAANLYLQMLMRNLLERKHTSSELEKKVKPYCNDGNFKFAIEQGTEIGKSEASLLFMIESGKFSKLNRQLRIKRIKSKVKNLIKRCLKAVGLYH